MAWTKESYHAFWAELETEADETYRQFHEKLLCSELEIIGLRTPFLRKIGKQIAKEDGLGYLALNPKGRHEERAMFGFVLGETKMPYDVFLKYCDTFTYEYVENWALCDLFCGLVKKVVKNNTRAFFEHCMTYTKSENPWAVRVGLIMMLSHYLNEEYINEVLEITDSVHSDFYYIRMAQAWLLATAWVKTRDKVKEYVSVCSLDDWTKAKFVQKSCESFRVSDEDKAWLREWKKNGFVIGV